MQVRPHLVSRLTMAVIVSKLVADPPPTDEEPGLTLGILHVQFYCEGQISILVQDDGHARRLLAATTATQSMAGSRRSREIILEGFLLTLEGDRTPVAIQLQPAPSSGSCPLDRSSSAT